MRAALIQVGGRQALPPCGIALTHPPRRHTFWAPTYELYRSGDPGRITQMELREFFSEDVIQLGLAGTTKDEVLKELIAVLGVDEKSEAILYKMLKRRENLGSTGIGKGIAIPHCRSLVVNRLRVAFGRKSEGLDFKAIDEQPVYNVFLIVAPPLEVSNQYLPVLGKIAQFSKEPDVAARLREIETPREFLSLLEEKRI
jgi:PTS system nitrogen regulatory IIA component